MVALIVVNKLNVAACSAAASAGVVATGGVHIVGSAKDEGGLGGGIANTLKLMLTEPGNIFTIFSLEGGMFRNVAMLLMNKFGPSVAKNWA